MIFRDRTDAGRQLARALEKYRETHPLVLALPRGGVVVGAEVARALGGEFDILLVKKLRAPENPELALGAISEDGRVYLNREVAQLLRVDREYLENEIAQRRAEIAAQQQQYRAVRPRVSPAGRTVIIVDDGLATGATMIAAIQATAMEQPAKLIVAVPVSPPEIANRIGKMPEVNECMALATPPDFQGVGQFYYDFTQVEDETVVQILKEFA